jgi:hypothetical protein
MEFGQQFRNFSKRAGFFYMPQSWDMGQIILLPLRRKASVGSEPAILGTKGQHANHQTTETAGFDPRTVQPVASRCTD